MNSMARIVFAAMMVAGFTFWLAGCAEVEDLRQDDENSEIGDGLQNETEVCVPVEVSSVCSDGVVCGLIDDGCGGYVNCGGCHLSDEICKANECIADPSSFPVTRDCAGPDGYLYCGVQPGRPGPVECGDTCSPHSLCVDFHCACRKNASLDRTCKDIFEGGYALTCRLNMYPLSRSRCEQVAPGEWCCP
jgi:hypothetical protein